MGARGRGDNPTEIRLRRTVNDWPQTILFPPLGQSREYTRGLITCFFSYFFVDYDLMATKKSATGTELAIIETGGKQYLVTPGMTISIEKLTGTDKDVSFDKVLMVSNDGKVSVGSPYLSGKKVTGEIVSDGKGKKVMVIKYKQKSRYLRTRGHRQPFVKVKISGIK